MPKRLEFPGEQPDEKVKMWLRKHLLVLIWAMKIPLLILLTFVLFLTGLSVMVPEMSPRLNSTGWLLASLVVFTLTSLWIIWECVLWYYDYFIVTDRRILDFRMVPFIYEKRDEAQLSRVQDVRINIPNVFAVLFDFGDVIVQTAGMKGQIVFTLVPNPRRVQAQLLALVAQGQVRRGEAGPLDQLATAFQQFLASPPQGESTNTLPLEKPQGEEKLTPNTWRQTLHNLALFSPVEGANPKTWRKHWCILLLAIIPPLMLIVLALALLILASVQIFIFIALLLLIISVFWLAWQVLDWYNDVYIVTDERIVDIEKTPLIFEDRREAQLSMIQDVSYVQPNFITRVLGFGNVIIETAGRAGMFTFVSVPNPQRVQRDIFARLEQVRRRQPAPASSQQVGEIIDLFELCRQARQSGRKSPPSP